MYIKRCISICVNDTLFDVGGVEMHSIECIEYCTIDQSNVKDVKDTLYRFQCIKAMYVEGVKNEKYYK